MFVTSKNYKRKCKITLQLGDKTVTLYIDPKTDKFQGRDILLNEIAIDAPNDVKFTVQKARFETDIEIKS